MEMTPKAFKELLATYCAMYGTVPYFVGTNEPRTYKTDSVGIVEYNDLKRGQFVNIYINGDDMRYMSEAKLKQRFEQSEILHASRCGNCVAVQFAPHYSDRAYMTSNIDFRREYQKALESERLQKIRQMQTLIQKAANEKNNKVFKNNTKVLAKELGMQDYASDPRLRDALSHAASDIVEAYTYQLWENEPAEFMISHAGYDTLMHELYDYTYAKLQQMQEMEQIQTQHAQGEQAQEHNPTQLAHLIEAASSPDWIEFDASHEMDDPNDRTLQ